jgi:hypothetical protein
LKIVVSIPENIYRSAERMVKSLNMSRNQLYTKALKEFIAQKESILIQRINAAYSDDDGLDPVLEMMQFRSLPVKRW